MVEKALLLSVLTAQLKVKILGQVLYEFNSGKQDLVVCLDLEPGIENVLLILIL